MTEYGLTAVFTLGAVDEIFRKTLLVWIRTLQTNTTQGIGAFGRLQRETANDSRRESICLVHNIILVRIMLYRSRNQVYNFATIIVILPIRGYFLFFLTIIYTLCQLNFSLCLNRQNQCFAILLVSNSYNSFRFTEINVVVKTKLAVSVCSRASLYDIYNVQ